MGFTKLDEGILQSSIMAESGTVFKVWIAILASCGPDGIARVSSIFLSSACHLSLAATDKAIEVLSSPDSRSRTLAEDGRRIRRVDGGYFLVNYEKYRAFTPQQGDPNSSGAIRTRRWREGKAHNVTAPPVVTPGDVTGVTSASASASSSEDKRKGVPASFEAFWDKYPRKVGKQDALSAFKAILKTAKPEEILLAVDAYKAEIDLKHTAEEYIKHPATFLRKDRWRDYLQKPKPTAAEFKAQHEAEMKKLRERG